MKHLVLISGVVYPQPSPTGRVLMEYVEPLKAEYDISVVYMSTSLDDNKPHEWNEYKLYPCTNWRLRLEQRCAERSTFFTKVGWMLAKLISRLQTKLCYPNNLSWLKRKGNSMLERINKEKKIDVVFSVSSPYAAHLAGAVYKHNHPDVRWMTYTVDPYSSKEHIFPFWLSLDNASKKERQCLSVADVRFMSEELIKNRKDLSERLEFTPLPYQLSFDDIKEINNSSGIGFNKNKIILVYAGSFYQKDRNPKMMLETTYSLRSSMIELHVFSSGACVDMVEEYSKKADSNIYFHGKIDRERLLAIYQEADVLVNIANQNPESSPSKIFEYIKFRKPIIEFSNNNEGGYLRKYPLALVLSDAEVDKEKKVVEFCEKTVGMLAPVQQLEEIYSKNMINNITSLIESSINGNE